MNTQRGTLLVVSLATAVLMLDIAVVNTALPHIASDLGAGLSGIQWVVDAYTLALASVVLTAGSVADRIGRRRVFTAGMAVFTVSSIACGLAGDIVALDTARAIQGLGGAAMFATSLSLLAEAYPDTGERVKALAVYGATIGASFAFGPLLGGALTTAFGWQAVFFVNVPLGIGVLYGTARWVRESRDENARGLDWPGQATLSLGLFLLVLALLRGNDDGWSSAPIVAELGGAAAMLVAFVAVERRVSAPMLPLGLFRRRDFTGAQIAAFAISASLFALFLYTTIYLQSVLGLSPLEAGLVYMPATMLNLIVAGGTAQLAGGFSHGALISVGLALVAIGLLLGTLAQTDSSWLILMPTLMISMIGTGMFNPAVSAVALSSAPQEMSGVAAGANDTFRQAGIAVGVAAFGAMIPSGDVLSGGSAQGFVDGLHVALIVGAAVAAIGAIASAKLLGVARPRVAAPAPVAEPAVEAC